MRHFLCLASLLISAVGYASDPLPLQNWDVPRASGGEGAVGGMADLSHAAIFIAVTPCRVVDTRNPDGPYGGPKAAQGGTRTFDIDSGPCTGIPEGAAAYSLNFGVTETAAGGYLTAWDSGTTQPVVATMTWFGGSQTLSSAAVVPASSSGAIDVYTAAGTHVTIDINGYFMATPGALNPETTLSVIGSTENATGMIFAENRDTGVTFVSSITGSLPYNTGGAAVKGEASATTGPTIGVYGRTWSGGTGAAGVRGWASSTSGATYGVRGTTASADANASGVYGETTAAGAKAGVLGKLGGNCSNCGGVQGVDASGKPNLTSVFFFPSGVTGYSKSNLAVSAVSEYLGVHAARLSTSGGRLTEALLAYNTYAVYGSVGDFGGTGAKYFVEPHPYRADKVIKYVALEGPEAGTYFRGTARTKGGVAVIDVPEDFRIVTDEEGLTVQLTAVGAPPSMYVESQDLNRIVVRSARDLTFHYHVHGIRRAFRHLEPIVNEAGEFMPKHAHDRLPEGLPEESRRRLIANGTFNEDGSVNLATAERLGWAQAWRDRDAAIAADQTATPTDPSDQRASPSR